MPLAKFLNFLDFNHSLQNYSNRKGFTNPIRKRGALRYFYTLFKASAVTKISEASEWTTSKIIEENQSAHHGPIEPLHMDYIIRKLVDDSLPKLDALLDE